MGRPSALERALRVIAVILAVVLYVLAFPPADLGPLAFLALAPWCWIARRWRGQRLFWVASLAGTALLTFGCFWIRRTAAVNLALMVVPESLFFGAFALLLRALHVARGWPAVLALPIAFTAVEVVRGRWPLDGFPWLTLGYSQHDFLELVQLSTLAGVHGVTFVLGIVAGAIADAARARQEKRRPVALIVALIVLAAVLGAGRLVMGDPTDLRAGPQLLLVQPNLEQRLKMDGAKGDVVLRRHFDLVDAALAREPAQLVVWSETMLMSALWPAEGEEVAGEPPEWRESRAFVREVLRERLFRRHGIPLFSGVLTYEPNGHGPMPPLRNSAILFDTDARRRATYDKKVRVPGGEYLPWIDAFPDSVAESIRRWVFDLAGFLPNLEAGTRRGVVDLAAVGVPGRAGMTICFEFAYPHVGRELVKEGADFLLNLSNEAWFPDTAEFDQATAMSVFRAVEIRRSLVRCANSGTSGWIDPWGRKHLLTKDGARHGFAGTQTVAPLLNDAVTPYVRFGEWLGVACWVAIAAGLVSLALRRRAPA